MTEIPTTNGMTAWDLDDTIALVEHPNAQAATAFATDTQFRYGAPQLDDSDVRELRKQGYAIGDGIEIMTESDVRDALTGR